MRVTYAGGPGCGHSHGGAAARNARRAREISVQCPGIRENAPPGSAPVQNEWESLVYRHLSTVRVKICGVGSPVQNEWESLPRLKNPPPGSENCRPQTRPAKFIIFIQKFWVYGYTPRLGPADCHGESCTARGRKPARASARARAAQTLGGLLRLF